MKIRQKLVLLLLTSSLIPVLVVGVLSFNEIKNTLRAETLNKMRLVVKEKEEALELFLETQLANLKYLAQDPTVISLTKKMVNAEKKYSPLDQQDAHKALKGQLVNFADFYGGSGLKGGMYSDIMVADMTGYMWIGTYGPDEGGNEADTEWFIEGAKGIYLGDIRYNPTMKQTTQIAAMPIRDGNGTIIALLQVESDISRINRILKVRTGGMGDTGDVYLVGREGIVLTEPRFNPETQGQQRLDRERIRKGLGEDTDVTVLRENYRGSPVLRSVHAFGHSLDIMSEQARGLIERLDWVIVGEIEEKEVFAPIIKLRNKILWVILVIALAITAAALNFSRIIAGPIVRLKDAAIAIGKGGLDRMVDVRSKDEVGQLAECFNTMADNLKKDRGKLADLAEKLEKKVDERTKELNAANEELETMNMELQQTNVEMEASNSDLEAIAAELEEAKAELEQKYAAREEFHRLVMGREKRVIELKEEIKRLEERLQERS